MRVLGIILICSIIFLSACNTIESFTTSDEKIDSRILFKSFVQKNVNLSYSTPGVYILLETEKVFGCIGYRLLAESRIEGNIINLTISGIYVPETCPTAPAPASIGFRFNIVDGKYLLVINGMGFKDEYDFIISDSVLTIIGDETEHTKPTDTLFYDRMRLPKN